MKAYVVAPDGEWQHIGYIQDDGIALSPYRTNDACCGCEECARLCHGCDTCEPETPAEASLTEKNTEKEN